MDGYLVKTKKGYVWKRLAPFQGNPNSLVEETLSSNGQWCIATAVPMICDKRGNRV